MCYTPQLVWLWLFEQEIPCSSPKQSTHGSCPVWGSSCLSLRLAGRVPLTREDQHPRSVNRTAEVLLLLACLGTVTKEPSMQPRSIFLFISPQTPCLYPVHCHLEI
jgi:hypothetical protein